MPRFLIIPAAGSGRRLGRSEPKALVSIGGRAMLAWTLEALSPLGFARTVVAAPADLRPEFERLVNGTAVVVAGGETRSASVRACFSQLADAAAGGTVCIHDGARPFVSAGEAASVIRAAEESGAAIAACPIVDTVKKVVAGRILETIDRTGLYAAGTPQVFRRELLERILATGRDATDEAAICESMGVSVAVVPISRLGFKITTPEDLEIAEAILARRVR